MRGSAALVLAVTTIALSGCDDVVGFDVAADGKVVVALDGQGRGCFAGDGSVDRDLFVIDAKTGKSERLTKASTPLTEVRAHAGGGAVAVLSHRTLVLVERDGTVKKLLEAGEGLRLFLPAVSADGARVAVVEAKKWGVVGTLSLVDVASAKVVRKLEGAIPGAAFSGDELHVARTRNVTLEPGEDAAPARSQSFSGEIVALAEKGEPRVVAKGVFAAVAPIGFLGKAPLVLSTAGDPEHLAVARVAGGKLTPLVEGTVAFVAPSPSGAKILFTRAAPDSPSLEGELFVASAAALEAATPVPTPGAVTAPRWVAEDRIVFWTRDGLVSQDLAGEGRVTLAPTAAVR